MSTSNYIKTTISNLPDKPGIYQYFDKEGTIIYIGKAKNLKKRVSSYFNKEHFDNGKLRILVSKIVDIKFLVVDSESDALLLENNLIKKYQPRYNILLKDDKTFPWICIKNELYPRVFSTRNVIQDGSFYFGPFTSGLMVKTLLEFIRKLFPLRTCNYDLTEYNIHSNKYKVCLEYHIGNCKAPCEGRITLSEYNTNIDLIKSIIKGNLSGLKAFLIDLMNKNANDLKFEEAALIKEKIVLLEKYQSKSTIVNSDINNVDVFSFLKDNNIVFINYLRIVNGSIVQSHTVEVHAQLDEENDEIFSTVISDVRARLFSNSNEVIVPFYPDIKLKGVKYSIPKLGDKFKLLELSERNLKYFILDRNKKLSEKNSENPAFITLERMRIDLRMSVQPFHIECFDNSNIQGTNPVAACVVFRNAKPFKNDYRHFNIKTVEGPNDFASMEEVIYRRYKRLKEEGEELPQLIIVDGGKGQLSAAVKILEELGIANKLTIIGIAKRLEEIFFPNDPIPLYIDKKSETLRIIQHIRNEAHRFGITFHRQKRSNNFIKSELSEIKGIGEKTIKTLFVHFNTIDNIKIASYKSLSNVIGESKALIVFDYFKINKNLKKL